jgi:hypothetical protein
MYLQQRRGTTLAFSAIVSAQLKQKKPYVTWHKNYRMSSNISGT